MDYSELLTNANFLSILSKIEALKSILTEEQQNQYSENLKNIVDDKIVNILEQIPNDKKEDFKKIVYATLD